MKAYKVELKPTQSQKETLNQTFGNCRWVYNAFLAHNQKERELGNKFVTGYHYSKFLNNSEDTPEWVKKTSSKATKKAIMDAEKAYKNFFKGLAKFPKWKKKGKSRDSAYLIGTIKTERHRVFLPTLKWVRIKEFGYIPKGAKIKSATVSRTADKYFVSILVDEAPIVYPKPTGDGIGIDLGIKDFAITSANKTYKNINKGGRLRKLEKRLKREQRKLSRKFEAKKRKGGETATESYANIRKQMMKVAKLHMRMTNIRTDYINQVIAEVIKQKPSYVTVEDLNVKGMMKNRHLSKAVAGQKFFEFKTKLIHKAKEHGIEVREVARNYPSSQLCSACGIKFDPEVQGERWSLKIRDWECKHCNTHHDRDLNASFNLKQAFGYKVLT